jgi:phosphoribosylanthranilate isomerase
MKVKICGVTSIADALMCARAGADLIGLNFYRQGKRYIAPEAAGEIASALRALPKPPTLVGVFVNASVSEMQSILDECSLDLAQLSGDEPDEVLQAMGARGFKAIRRRYLPITNNQLLLFDAHAAGQYGGTGQTADWEVAASIARQCRLLLAGGLTPENVAEAIRRVQPWGVDVASGVESAPGVKDKSKVVAFIKAAKQYDPISNF